MSKLRDNVTHVIENQSEYPACVITIAQEMHDCFQTRREGVLKLKTECNEMWKLWLNILAQQKKTGDTYKQRHWFASRQLMAKYDRQANELFHKAKGTKNTARWVIESFRHEFEGCLKLLREENLNRVYEWHRCVGTKEVNESLVDVAYLRPIRYACIAEILAWKAMKNV